MGMVNKARMIPSLVALLASPFFSWAEANPLAAEQSGRLEKQRREEVRQEEQEDYYKKWLNEDVKYIIAPEEKTVFQKLNTGDEKERFIEQFWYRRDPNTATSLNEFKEEHYRRIAYANERFSSGLPGWQTDRGRTYIIHGPPDEIDSHPSGGTYNRSMDEGGGMTSTFPFELWRYRYIEGIGQDVELEFVDPSWSGEYRLARLPEEKDALLRVPGAGLTLAEQLGLAGKVDRPFFSPGNRDSYPLIDRENPFIRYETYVTVQRPKQIKYKDLKEIVNVNLSYSNLPLKIREDYIKLNDQQVLVPVTVELQNKDLTFSEMESGGRSAKIAVYGIITSIRNRVIAEFEEDLVSSYQPQSSQQALGGRSLYQKIVLLDNKMRYKLDLVVKDLNSGNVGVVRRGIIPPTYDEGELSFSSLILSDYIRTLDQVPKDDRMFVLGDVWIRPSLSNVFSHDQPLGVYFQLYHAAVDQSTRTPSVEVTYKILQEGDPVVELKDQSGNSVQFYSNQRMVFIRELPIKDLQPGKYTVQIRVRDRISNQVATVSEEFEVTRGAGMAPHR
ncbi:GWxTD domain-containing protein [Acidobacteria bacterium AH-259-D05]|nr:GWxTD domain-containing protein [Acidobacteria bacterium AH-259-D05]